MKRTTIIYKVDGGEEQEYICVSLYSESEVLYLLANKPKNRNRNIEIVRISQEKA